VAELREMSGEARELVGAKLREMSGEAKRDGLATAERDELRK
jgi:hypothetical protein